jgi:Mg-chelatase subunit ChlD
MRREITLQSKDTPEAASLVILADVSGSMRGDKIIRLKRELRAIWGERSGAKLMSFATNLHWLDGPDDLPPAGGSTDLAGALEAAAPTWPGEVLVISDGQPEDEDRALAAAKLIPGTISVLFVGSDDDREGQAFLQKLATLGGGEFCHKDLAKHSSLASELRSMLALPPPISL